MSAPLAACVNLSLAMIIVGSSVTAGKIMVGELPVHLASALRFVLASALLVPLFLVREGGLPRLSPKSWGLLALQALFGSFGFTVFLLHGLKLTTPGAAGVITSATPACVALIAWLILKERPNRNVLVGVALSVAGVALVNLGGPGQSAGGPENSLTDALWGNLLVMAAVVCESLFLLLRKTVPEPLSPLAVSSLVSLFGLGWFAVPAAIEAASFDFGAVTTIGWLSVAYYGLVVTVLAYLFWFAGVTRVAAGVAGVFTAVMPVSALLLSALILDERPGLPHLFGCALVLGGIVGISGVFGRRPGARRPAGNSPESSAA